MSKMTDFIMKFYPGGGPGGRRRFLSFEFFWSDGSMPLGAVSLLGWEGRLDAAGSGVFAWVGGTARRRWAASLLGWGRRCWRPRLRSAARFRCAPSRSRASPYEKMYTESCLRASTTQLSVYIFSHCSLLTCTLYPHFPHKESVIAVIF